MPKYSSLRKTINVSLFFNGFSRILNEHAWSPVFLGSTILVTSFSENAPVLKQVSFGRLYPAATLAFESNLPKLYLFHNPLHQNKKILTARKSVNLTPLFPALFQSAIECSQNDSFVSRDSSSRLQFSYNSYQEP